MGLDCTTHFSTAETPAWEAIHTSLVRVIDSPQLRMIDGLPAFPDEIPTDDWKELRLGFDSGMVTIRRRRSALTCVVWGNADEALHSAWNRVVWACAVAGNGTIESTTGRSTPEEFAHNHGIIPSAAVSS